MEGTDVAAKHFSQSPLKEISGLIVKCLVD